MTVCYLNKEEKALLLPKLFDLFYENMSVIAPSGMAYEAERAAWLSNVSPALDKEPRKVLLALDGEELAGFVMFYSRDDLLMVEEVQLRRSYQGGLLFFRLCRKLLADLPEVCAVEAYADSRNRRSLVLMKKLGMTPVPGEGPGPYVHLRGDARAITAYFRLNGAS